MNNKNKSFLSIAMQGIVLFRVLVFNLILIENKKLVIDKVFTFSFFFCFGDLKNKIFSKVYKLKN